jgi:hypothetical protein
LDVPFWRVADEVHAGKRVGQRAKDMSSLDHRIHGEESLEIIVVIAANGPGDEAPNLDRERVRDGVEVEQLCSLAGHLCDGVLAILERLQIGCDVGQPLAGNRDRAVFRLAADKLAEAEAEYRIQRAEQIIRSATRKAVIGAMAAVSPGTDILVQGYIGTAMTQELCSLYGATPRDLDIEEFLSLGESKAGRALPLSMAVAGNGLKAFPGLGTVAGGLAHAVAYGLIFDALGRSLISTLSRHGELVPDAAANEFEEGISEHLEAGVRRIAKMALDEKRA